MRRFFCADSSQEGLGMRFNMPVALIAFRARTLAR